MGIKSSNVRRLASAGVSACWPLAAGAAARTGQIKEPDLVEGAARAAS